MNDPTVGIVERLQALVSLHIVPRWAIVPMTRQQSVAEHCYNVVAIAEALWKLLHRGMVERGQAGEMQTLFPTLTEVYQYALDHDMSECATGDIPHQVKAHYETIHMAEADIDDKFVQMGASTTVSALVKCIVKIADGMEAYMYCQRYCASRGLKARILARIHASTAVHVRALVSVFRLEDAVVANAMSVVAKALADDGTYWMRAADREKAKTRATNATISGT